VSPNIAKYFFIVLKLIFQCRNRGLFLRYFAFCDIGRTQKKYSLYRKTWNIKTVEITIKIILEPKLVKTMDFVMKNAKEMAEAGRNTTLVVETTTGRSTTEAFLNVTEPVCCKLVFTVLQNI